MSFLKLVVLGEGGKKKRTGGGENKEVAAALVFFLSGLSHSAGSS